MDENNYLPIKAYVVGVLDKNQLIINAGEKNGVEIGMRFQIMEFGEGELNALYDPITNEKLGNIPYEKTRVKVYSVFEKFSICKTYRIYQIPSKFDFSDLLGTTREFSSGSIVETLEFDDDIKIHLTSGSGKKIKKGDFALQIIDDNKSSDASD